MDREKEKRIESARKHIGFFPMNITKDKKQVSVRIPNEIADALDINPKKDIFVFVFDKKALILMGSLEDKKVWWEAIHGKKEGRKENS